MVVRTLVWAGVAGLGFVGALVGALPTAAPAASEPVRASSARPALTIVLPARVVEGDRFWIRITVRAPAAARRVVLERQVADFLGDTSWQTAGGQRVRGRHVVLRTVADAEGTGRYRARLTLADGATSRPAAGRTKVWRWTQLSAFDQYYGTSGLWDLGESSFAIGGTQYRGWSVSIGSYPRWEGRYTLGRHCSRLRGVFGVTDESADGSSATTEIVTDETRSAYVSPSLNPGMSVSPRVALRRAYRISIRATNTSPAGAEVHPAIGDPEVLCAGL